MKIVMLFLLKYKKFLLYYYIIKIVRMATFHIWFSVLVFSPSFPCMKTANRASIRRSTCLRVWCVCLPANMHRPRGGMHASNAKGKGSPYSRGDTRRHRGTRYFSRRSSRWKSIDLWLRRLRVPINVITELLYVPPQSVYIPNEILGRIIRIRAAETTSSKMRANSTASLVYRQKHSFGIATKHDKIYNIINKLSKITISFYAVIS